MDPKDLSVATPCQGQGHLSLEISRAASKGSQELKIQPS